MRITVVGVGYVGLVTGLTLAEQGEYVTLLDVDPVRIARLRTGESPIYEPGLEELLTAQVALGRVTFSTRYDEAVPGRDLVFLCVGTPSNAMGATDLDQLSRALEALVPHLDPECTVVIKSTVPVGTNRWAKDLLVTRRRQAGLPWENISFVSNPEFLREGSAVWDSRNPDRIVIGATEDHAFRTMERLYEGAQAPILPVLPEEAELIKYASNAFLAQKISFINLMADLCEAHGADVRRVAEGMGLDPRIGPRFLAAGLGFGGSCFPKDVRSLVHQLKAKGLSSIILDETLRINRARVSLAVRKLTGALGGLANRRIALLGLAFKPNTDDIRESQGLKIAEALIAASAQVTAYDPEAMANAAERLPELQYAANPEEACVGADAVVVATDWPVFAELPWERILADMRSKVILDCRNMLDGAAIAELGGRYMGMGVPAAGRSDQDG